MTLIDVNILLHAHDTESQWFPAASAWLEKTLGNTAVVRLAPVTVLAFLRIVTDARLTRMAKPIGDAVKVVDRWLSRENVTLLEPGPRHWSVLRELLVDLRAGGPFVTDCHLAALAIEHGAALYTNDQDFRRFAHLDVRFPLLERA